MPRRFRKRADPTQKPRQYSDPLAAGLTRGLTLKRNESTQPGPETPRQSFENTYPEFQFSPLVSLAIALAQRIKATLRMRRRDTAVPLRSPIENKCNPDVKDLPHDDWN